MLSEEVEGMLKRSATARVLERDWGSAVVEGVRRKQNYWLVTHEGIMEGIRGKLGKRMQRWLKKEEIGLTVSDWVWDWVRREQWEGRLDPTLERRVSGGPRGGSVRSGWREGEAGQGWSWSRVVAAAEAVVLRIQGNLQLTRMRQMRRTSWRSFCGKMRHCLSGEGSHGMLTVVLWELAATCGVLVEGQGDDKVVSGEWQSAAWWLEMECQAKARG
jgi:hypothetical protein